MAILQEVKLALRISNNAFDSEITDIIDACKIDLVEAGAENTDDTDALVKRAIILYAKANFGMANPDMEKYQKAYDRLKITMALSGEYKTGGA
jgi:hypothetical protein